MSATRPIGKRRNRSKMSATLCVKDGPLYKHSFSESPLVLAEASKMILSFVVSLSSLTTLTTPIRKVVCPVGSGCVPWILYCFYDALVDLFLDDAVILLKNVCSLFQSPD